MSIHTPKFDHSYEEFKNFFEKESTLFNQKKIISIKDFFDTEERFMSALHQAYQIYSNYINDHIIDHNKISAATNQGKENLYSSMKNYNFNKLSYFRDKVILEQELYSVMKEYRNFINNKEKEDKSKKEEMTENTSAKVSSTLEDKNYARRHHHNARVIDGNVYTPYTTPEEIENKERREEARNKNTSSFDVHKKEINDPKEISIKKDKLGQLYIDFFAEEADSDK